MEAALYYLVLGLVRFLQCLPLPVVAWVGRRCGALAYCLDARHRRVAVDNLTLAFGGEKSPGEIRALARENFRRIGENFASAVKTSSMGLTALGRHLEILGAEKILAAAPEEVPRSRMFVVGHFGNFELYAWVSRFLPGYQSVTTYRAVRQSRLDGLLRSIREASGCVVLERRKDGARLREIMNHPGMMVGLLSDQHAGRGGLWLPFFGRECSTLAAPAIFALRYKMPLHVAICYRVGLARWRIEIGDEIPVRLNGRRRSVEELMTHVNQELERAIRRDPANWFWVHRRWKTEKVRPRPAASAHVTDSAEAPHA